MEGYYYLGKILKPFAAKGALLIHLDVDTPEDYTEMESVFVLMNGQLIPFVINSIDLKHNNKAVITLPDIDTVDQASILSGCDLYQPVSMLKPLSGNRFYYHEVPGFEVYDKQHGFIGTIKEVLEYPHQAVLSVYFKEKEILIPITDEIITGIDRQKRQLFTNAPEGLIELYLGS
ncbi:MAG TPA: ribosome maturation factor RimM [Lentimicrobium sp.]|nr:ribosome maturation factor RimM [Lentimicrobium sp.]